MASRARADPVGDRGATSAHSGAPSSRTQSVVPRRGGAAPAGRGRPASPVASALPRRTTSAAPRRATLPHDFFAPGGSACSSGPPRRACRTRRSSRGWRSWRSSRSSRRPRWGAPPARPRASGRSVSPDRRRSEGRPRPSRSSRKERASLAFPAPVRVVRDRWVVPPRAGRAVPVGRAERAELEGRAERAELEGRAERAELVAPVPRRDSPVRSGRRERLSPLPRAAPPGRAGRAVRPVRPTLPPVRPVLPAPDVRAPPVRSAPERLERTGRPPPVAPVRRGALPRAVEERPPVPPPLPPAVLRRA